MEVNDYDVIVFKLLVYLYAVFKRVTNYSDDELKLAVKYDRLDDQYFLNVLQMIQGEGLISGYRAVTAWGREQMMLSSFSDLRITAQGIHYLEDNSKMNKVKDFLFENKDVIVSLIKLMA